MLRGPAGDEAVDDPDAVAAADERFNQVRADEAGTASDEVESHEDQRGARSVGAWARRRQSDGRRADVRSGCSRAGKPNSVTGAPALLRVAG